MLENVTADRERLWKSMPMRFRDKVVTEAENIVALTAKAMRNEGLVAAVDGEAASIVDFSKLQLTMTIPEVMKDLKVMRDRGNSALTQAVDCIERDVGVMTKLYHILRCAFAIVFPAYQAPSNSKHNQVYTQQTIL